jgi:hypothetical protein
MSQATAPIRHTDRFYTGGQWVEPSSDAKISVIVFARLLRSYDPCKSGCADARTGCHPSSRTMSVNDLGNFALPGDKACVARVKVPCNAEFPRYGHGRTAAYPANRAYETTQSGDGGDVS